MDLFPAEVNLVASLLRQIRVSKHTLSMACFRVVDLFPAEGNLCLLSSCDSSRFLFRNIRIVICVPAVSSVTPGLYFNLCCELAPPVPNVHMR